MPLFAGIPARSSALPVSPVRRLPPTPLAAAGVALVVLVFSNPQMTDFQEFVAGRLVDEIAEELCREADLPLMLRLAMPDCERMVSEQRAALAAVVRQHSRRINLGLFSLYRSEIGGQRVLEWRVPRLRSLVLGVAGSFVPLWVDLDSGKEAGATDDAGPLGWQPP